MYVIDFWNGFICESGCWPRIYSTYTSTDVPAELPKVCACARRVADSHCAGALLSDNNNAHCVLTSIVSRLDVHY